MATAIVETITPHINNGKDYLKVKLEATLSVKETQEMLGKTNFGQIKISFN